MHSLLVLLTMALIVIGIQFGMRFFRMRRLGYWLKRGMEAYGEARYQDALRAFRKCVGIAPEWLHSRAMLGMSLAQTGNKEEALREITLVQQLQPRQGEAWTLTCLFYALCAPEDHDKLAEAIETLHALDPPAAAALVMKPQFRQFDNTRRFRELFRRVQTQKQPEAD